MGWEETGLDGDGRRKDWMGWEETGLDGMGGDRLGGTGRNRGKTRRVWVVWDETGQSGMGRDRNKLECEGTARYGKEQYVTAWQGMIRCILRNGRIGPSRHGSMPRRYGMGRGGMGLDRLERGDRAGWGRMGWDGMTWAVEATGWHRLGPSACILLRGCASWNGSAKPC